MRVERASGKCGSSRSAFAGRGAFVYAEAMSDCPAIRVMMMPRDTNAHGTIFGGVILSYIDQAGAVEARRQTHHRFVTVAIDHVDFKAPVYIGDILSFYTRLEKIGRTSMTIHVDVQAERFQSPGTEVPVTDARLVYVAVDEDRNPTPVRPAE
jgi:acyl-CoA thioesterase YciA